MPPHFFHTLETILEYPEEAKKMTEKYQEDDCVDRLREMTPSKSLKEAKREHQTQFLDPKDAWKTHF
ncbi:unnamed protein product [Caenorhabditis brenneri]